MLSRFFNRHPQTRLHLDVEAVGGPVERLLDGTADLIIHGIDKHDTRLEWLDLGSVPFVPVDAAGYLPFPVTRTLRSDDLRDQIQAVIRDTASHSPTRDHFMIAGARQCSVPDQPMKKELILQGLAWGHLPRFLVEKELRQGKLVALSGRHMKGSVEELVAARRADREHGPVAQALWEQIRLQPRLTAPVRQKT
jgi:DNA-binding transcriptional LysR family regulator